MTTLYLYTTLGCHLCEQCKSIIWPVINNMSIRLQDIEIADDNVLIEQYGVRIPVVRLEGEKEDLGWPFTAQDLSRYLASGIK